MSLVAHKAIDALRGADPRVRPSAIPGVDAMDLRRLAATIAGAEKFDFGLLDWEVNEDRSSVMVPDMTQDEWDMWAAGLLPPPAPSCWYEFRLLPTSTCTSGLLVEAGDDGRWHVARVEYDERQGVVMWDGVAVIVDPRNRSKGGLFVAEATGNLPLLRRMREAGQDLQALVAHNAPLAIYLTMMLCSRTTEVAAEIAPPKLNRARAARGRQPLFDHRVVRVVPQRYRDGAPGGGGTHASPRLHWRRSHVRCYDRATEASRWCPGWLHEGRRGWHCVAITRQLIGRAELGTVTHDYKVGAKT